MPTTEPTDPMQPNELPPFECLPKYMYDMNGGGSSTLAIVVHQPTPEGKRASREYRQRWLGSCRDLLTRTREEFFATGPGWELRDKEEKLQAAEQTIVDSERAIDRLREQWRIAVSADTAKDVAELEAQIEQQERSLARLKVRVPVLREEVTKARRDTANQLFKLIRNTNDEYKRAAEQQVEAARSVLTTAVNTAWSEWLRADAEVSGVVVNLDELMRMASSAAQVPNAGKGDPATMPDALPLPPATPPKQERLYPWGKEGASGANVTSLESDERVVKVQL